MRIARVLLAVLALAVCAWFAVGIRQAHQSDAAAAIVGAAGGQSAADLARAQRLIDSADFLYPGQDIANLRAEQLLEQRRYDRAAPVIASIVRAEPQNLQGWIDVAKLLILAPRVARGTGLTAAQARAQVVRLDPVDARRLGAVSGAARR